MKNLIILFILSVGVNISLHSQVMRTFNYQGIVLNDEGQPLANENVSINVKIVEAGLDYSTSATTSSLGAFSVPIEIDLNISFAPDVNYTIESSITTSAGTVSSTAPLSVVPMALFADKAAGLIGIDVIDESPENELQTLSIDGSVLTISDGNSVNLPSGGDGGGDGDNDPNNEIQEISVTKTGEEITLQLDPGDIISFDISDNDNNAQNEIQNLSIDNGNLVLSNGGGQIAISSLGDGVDDADADPGNEIQTLAVDGFELTISDGNSITLPDSADGVEDDDADPNNELQTLTVAGSVLTISNGNSVNLPTGGGGGDADSDPNNEIQDLNSSENGSERTIGITLGGVSTTIDINDADADATNEFQNLDLFGNMLSIIDGNTVDLSNLTIDVDDADADPANEIQDLELMGDILSITDGSSIDLSTVAFDVDDADADPNNELQDLSSTVSGSERTISISLGASTTIDIDDADADDSNEIQDIELVGNTLSITDGSSIDLSTVAFDVDDADADPLNEIQDLSSFAAGNNRTITISGGNQTTFEVMDADADPLNEIQDLSSFAAGNNRTITISGGNQTTFEVMDADADPLNELQDLSLSGNMLSISSGTGVDLSALGGSSVWDDTVADIFYSGGSVGIGTSTPTETLQVDGSIKAGTFSGNTFTGLSSYTTEVDGGIRPKLDNLDPLGASTKRYTSLWASDGTINTSDRREKKNIKTLEYGLADVMNLKPVVFQWINGRSSKSNLGFIAQDLQTTLPEVVVDQDTYRDESGNIHYKPAERLGVKYSDIIPVTVKAIQEQQEIILSQNERIEKLEAELKEIKELILMGK